MYLTIVTFLPIAEKKMLRYDKTYKSYIFCVHHTHKLLYIIQYQYNKLYSMQLDRIQFKYNYNTRTIIQYSEYTI